LDRSLEDKRVLVTAGAGGIGLAIAGTLAEAGARVWVCDSDPEALARLPEIAPALAAGLCDVADPEQVARLFDRLVAALGGLDILVNNAGIAGPTGFVEDCSIEDWRRTLAVDLDGQFHCLRHAVPLLKAAGGGSIINIASTAGFLGYPLRAPYVAAKWGVVGLSKALAIELGPFGIRVNAVCPGAVEGPRMDRVIAAEARARGVPEAEVRSGYLRQSSLRCFVSAGDVARMVRFVCSGAGARISGQALAVDGNTESLTL